MAKELKKASSIKRICAYVIDYLIIVILVSLLSTPFLDVKKVEKLDESAATIVERYNNGEINSEQYMDEYTSIYYSLSRSTGVMTFITIIIDILYFVVFQLYNKGQTLGKKLMRIKVVSDTGELSMNQMIFRSFISNMILLSIINFALITFGSKDIYIGVSIVLSMIQYIIVFISIILLFKKEGRTIHDRIAHTRVVSIK